MANKTDLINILKKQSKDAAKQLATSINALHPENVRVSLGQVTAINRLSTDRVIDVMVRRRIHSVYVAGDASFTTGDYIPVLLDRNAIVSGWVIGGGPISNSSGTFYDPAMYALLSGRSGGQNLRGGTGPNENLTLQSTSHANKGKILFGSSAYDETNNRLGIGTTSPLASFQVIGDSLMSGYLSVGITSPSYHTGSGDLSIIKLFGGNTDDDLSASSLLFRFWQTFTGTSQALTSFLFRTDLSPTATRTAAATNFLNQLRLQGSYDFSAQFNIAFLAQNMLHSSGGVTGALQGILGRGLVLDTSTPSLFGTVNWGRGGQFQAMNRAGTASGTFSNGAALYIQESSAKGPVNFINQYGLYIESLASAINNWDIYHAGLSPNIGIGNTGTLSWKDVAGNLLMSLTDAGTVGNWILTGALAHQGTTTGFFNIGPVTRPTAYTQTYAMATKTHNNPTATTVTGTSTNVSPWGYTTQGAADNIILSINNLIVDVANSKQVLNQVIDDLQSLGLLS